MLSITITPTERRSGQIAADKMHTALHALAEDGVVALRGAIDLEPVDKLGAKMLADLADYEKEYEIDNNFQGIRPPPFQPWLFPEIIFNEPAIAISRAILGDGATLTSYGANTAFVGSQNQHIHADAVPPEPGPYGPCRLLVINVPLVWGVDLVALYLARFVDIGFGLIALWLTVINAIVHIAAAGRFRGYNPGLVTAVILFLPFGIWGIVVVSAVPGVGAGYQILGLALAILTHVAIAVHVFRRARMLKGTSG